MVDSLLGAEIFWRLHSHTVQIRFQNQPFNKGECTQFRASKRHLVPTTHILLVLFESPAHEEGGIEHALPRRPLLVGMQIHFRESRRSIKIEFLNVFAVSDDKGERENKQNTG
jgi:hypothetical protein